VTTSVARVPHQCVQQPPGLHCRLRGGPSPEQHRRRASSSSRGQPEGQKGEADAPSAQVGVIDHQGQGADFRGQIGAKASTSPLRKTRERTVRATGVPQLYPASPPAGQANKAVPPPRGGRPSKQPGLLPPATPTRRGTGSVPAGRTTPKKTAKLFSSSSSARCSQHPGIKTLRPRRIAGGAAASRHGLADPCRALHPQAPPRGVL